MNLELELIDQGYSFMKMNGLIIKQFFKAQTLRIFSNVKLPKIIFLLCKYSKHLLSSISI